MHMRKRCLIDELSANKGNTVFLGVRSSFFYIGSAEEAINDIQVVGLMAKFCVPLTSGKEVSDKIAATSGHDIAGRHVLNSYNRESPDGQREVVIIIDGKEYGAFWTRAEYLAGRQMLIDALGKSKTEQ